MSNSESVFSKIGLAVFSAALGVIGSIAVLHFSEKQPHLSLTITPPHQVFGQNKVTQFLTLKNDGHDVAKGIRIGLKSAQGRLYEDEIRVTYSPIRTDPTPAPQCGPQGDCVMMIGNLQPHAFSTVQLTYRLPVMGQGDIQTFSDNAEARGED